jgi:hypothetical protein
MRPTLSDSARVFHAGRAFSSGRLAEKRPPVLIIVELEMVDLLAYAMSNCIITAPRLATVHDDVWKEFAGHQAAIKAGPHKWLAEYVKVEHKKVYIIGSKLDWWNIAKTAPVGRPEKYRWRAQQMADVAVR